MSSNQQKMAFDYFTTSVADPGFPVGGGHVPIGGMDPRCGHFLAKMYVKMKESGPMGGMHLACPQLAPPQPPMHLNPLSTDRY